jgi:cardiolipin synthase
MSTPNPVPNALVAFRIAMAPVVLIALILGTGSTAALWPTVAFVAFVLAALSDAFDGMLARATRSESAWGARWDPIADKLLIAAALAGLAWSGVLLGWPLIAAVVLVGRDLFVDWLRRTREIKVGWLGKLKTVVAMLAVTCLLGGPALLAQTGASSGGYGSMWLPANMLTFGGNRLLAVAAVLAVISAGLYLLRRQGPAAPRAAAA